MSTISNQGLILSPKGVAGATVYNSYYFFTQLSGLYALAYETATQDEDKKPWMLLSDSTIEDVGLMYAVWEWALKEIKAGSMKPEVDLEWTRVARACKRLAMVHKIVNFWTPRRRWALLADLGEYRWQRILNGLKLQSEEMWELAHPLRASSDQRRKSLKILINSYASKEKSINQWFGKEEELLVQDEKSPGDTQGSKTPSQNTPLKIVGGL